MYIYIYLHIDKDLYLYLIEFDMAIENGPVDIVSFPSYKMVNLSMVMLNSRG